MTEKDQDEWRSCYQQLPLSVYERFMIQLKRIAIANGISEEAFLRDNKFEARIGPRVMCYETLTIMLEGLGDSDLRQF